MNFQTASATLEQHFNTLMSSAEPSVTIQRENTPGASSPPSPLTGEWVRYGFQPGEDVPASIGRNHWRGTALVTVQVFTPLGVGRGSNLRIQRSIQTIFRDNPVAGIRVRDLNFRLLGERDGFFMGFATVRVQADEIF